MAPTLRLEILTIERKLFDDEVNMVIAPGAEGVLGILPRHIPLVTLLTYGELQVKKEGQDDQFFAIGGGFMEVQPDHVIVMADSAERDEEIDLDRAEAARKRAEERLQKAREDESFDAARAEAALRRSLARIKVARRRRRDHVRGPRREQ
ncbi:MAG: F0F1 ATP synthase subunit epsilon [Chloroflexi bacterium]|nr:MAG: F0F1 ATP synthase subunit epsilon [Chloroflexota bacterium]